MANEGIETMNTTLPIGWGHHPNPPRHIPAFGRRQANALRWLLERPGNLQLSEAVLIQTLRERFFISKAAASDVVHEARKDLGVSA